MKCSKCQYENPEDSKFCFECGEKIEPKCPKCNKSTPNGMKFCNGCGHDLQKPTSTPPIDVNRPQSYTPKHLADKILTTRTSIEGERKVVSVLFADVANFTPISEKLDPEEVHQIMDGCFKILMKEIHKNEGTINQFTGDGVMALFGAPVAHEDHAQKACYAALSIQEALQEYGKLLKDKFGVDFNMRIGINSGPVVVGSIGDDLRMDYTAIGDTTNLAARMESLAQPGTILVSENTSRKVRSSFQLEPLGKFDVKGKEIRQEAYMLKGHISKPATGFTRKIYSRIVGRDRELDKLEFQLMKAINGEGSIVNIMGEAGIGKSRLAVELKKREMIKKTTLLEGRAVSIGGNLSFHPIVDLLKNWVHIGEDDTEAMAFERLRTSIRNIMPDQFDEVLPFVATLMGMKLTGRYAERVKGIKGEALEKLILKNVRDLLCKASEAIPLVIMIEDLHWADMSTIALLESLFRLVETEKIVFINVFRPRYSETGVRIVQHVADNFPNHFVEIELQTLDEQMSEALVNNMLNISGLPHAVRDRIVKRAGGNPFFIEEVVRSFIDEGAIVKKNGAFEITDKIDSVVIPHTINDVLTARIDRIEEETRGLLKTASVIGRSFFYRILAEVAKNIENVDIRLEYLKEKQLIRERINKEELEYLFKHALAQEAAYESILLKKRKELHLMVAESIETVFKEKLHEFYGMLAYHYSKGEDLEKAEAFMVKAGEEALQASASSEALSYYQDALRLYMDIHKDDADSEKLATFEKNIALAYFYKGQDENAIEYFDRVLNRWNLGSPQNTMIQGLKVIYDLTMITLHLYLPFKRKGKSPNERDNEAFDFCYKKAISLVNVNPMRNFLEQMSTVKRGFKFDLKKVENGVIFPLSASGCLSFAGFLPNLRKKLLKYAEDIGNFDDPKELMEYELYYNFSNVNIGNFNDLKQYNEFLVEENLKIGEFWHVTIYLYCYVAFEIVNGNFERALMLIDKLKDINKTYEYEVAKVLYYICNVAYNNCIGNFHKSLNECDEGILLCRQLGAESYLILLANNKAIAQINMNDKDGAKTTLNFSEECMKTQGFMPPMASIGYFMGRLLFDLMLLEEAIDENNKSILPKYRKKACHSYKKVLKIYNKYGAGVIPSLNLFSRYFWLLDKQGKAIKLWGNTIERAKDNGMVGPHLARTYMEIGRRLMEKKSRYKEINGIKAEEYLEKAREMFEEMEMQWDLDELERITSA
jgi:class 3 adenylate cyclase